MILLFEVFNSWSHVHQHHFNDADWFIKVDDDTYVIMENLRYFLSQQDPNKYVCTVNLIGCLGRFIITGSFYPI